MPSPWTFSPSMGRYRDPKGKVHNYADVRKVFDLRVADTRTTMQDLGRRYSDGKIDLATFERSMRAEIKRLHVEGRVLGVGGRAMATKSDYGKTGASIKAEYRYLRGFVADIESGRHSPEGIVNRAGLYSGSNAIQQFEDGRQGVMIRAGYGQKRFAGPDDDRTCGDCRDKLARGWVDADDPDMAIGDSSCGSNCRHTIEYRRGG